MSELEKKKKYLEEIIEIDYALNKKKEEELENKIKDLEKENKELKDKLLCAALLNLLLISSNLTSLNEYKVQDCNIRYKFNDFGNIK